MDYPNQQLTKVHLVPGVEVSGRWFLALGGSIVTQDGKILFQLYVFIHRLTCVTGFLKGYFTPTPFIYILPYAFPASSHFPQSDHLVP